MTGTATLSLPYTAAFSMIPAQIIIVCEMHGHLISHPRSVSKERSASQWVGDLDDRGTHFTVNPWRGDRLVGSAAQLENPLGAA
jgi:hypothetical protein